MVLGTYNLADFCGFAYVGIVYFHKAGNCSIFIFSYCWAYTATHTFNWYFSI